MTRLIAWTLIVALAAGCATARPQPTRTEAEEKMARNQQECAQLAATAAESAGMGETMRGVGLLGFYLVLLGASEGAMWGALSGGSRSDGAWIGAAVGAGIGTIVGLVAGVKKGAERHRQYRETYDRCLTDRSQPV